MQLEGGTGMSKDELVSVGCAISDLHHDVMISDDQTCVIAIRADGSRELLIENGKLTGSLAA